MQQTSVLYRELFQKYQEGQSDVRYETRLAIGDTGVLVTQSGESITFGGFSILVGTSGADSGYDESFLITLGADFRIFSGEAPTVGSCVASEIDVVMMKPIAALPRRGRMVPYVRLTDGTRHSEWLQKGVFYIDTRETIEDGSSIKKIAFHGYDDMLKAEQDYPASKLAWPAKDTDVVKEIAAFMDVKVDSRTLTVMKRSYQIEYPAGYTCREVLGYIAAMYAGCFVMSDLGELRLITIYGIEKETRYLIDRDGSAITFGGVRILV